METATYSVPTFQEVLSRDRRPWGASNSMSSTLHTGDVTYDEVLHGRESEVLADVQVDDWCVSSECK